MKRAILIAMLGAVGVAGWLIASGQLPLRTVLEHPALQKAQADDQEPVGAAPPAVSVIKVAPAEFVETVMVTGTLVPREEILVAPEVEGLRVLEVHVEEGDWVREGQVLATLVHATLDAQLAQNAALLAKADASIARAQSAIAQAEAALKEAEQIGCHVPPRLFW